LRKKKKVEFDKNLTEIIFFDLEFYIPKEDRVKDKKGVSLFANPCRDRHFLLGGVFCRIFPFKSFDDREIQNFWIWELKTEKAVLEAIYKFFKESQDRMRNKRKEQADLIVVGIGISRFDLPVLFIRSMFHEIASPEELFNCYYKLKPVDLSDVGISFIKRDLPILYPVTKSELNKAILNDSENNNSGISVSNVYDFNEFNKIKERTNKEVVHAIELYSKILDDIFLSS